MTADLTKLAFYSLTNYLKRDSSSGSDNVVLPSTGNIVNRVVTHGLNYIPFYEVYTEIDNSGIIWNNTKIDQYTGSSNPRTRDNPSVSNWVTTTDLTISLTNDSGSSGSRAIYWLIYKDYGNL